MRLATTRRKVTTRKLCQEIEIELKKGRIQIKVLFFQPPHTSHGSLKRRSIAEYLQSTMSLSKILQFLQGRGQCFSELTALGHSFSAYLCQRQQHK